MSKRAFDILPPYPKDEPRTYHHHKDKDKKERGICYLVSNGYSTEKIQEELKKCEVLCANCHRKLHYKTAIFKRD